MTMNFRLSFPLFSSSFFYCRCVVTLPSLSLHGFREYVVYIVEKATLSINRVAQTTSSTLEHYKLLSEGSIKYVVRNALNIILVKR